MAKQKNAPPFINLKNTTPVPDTTLDEPQHAKLKQVFQKLQGNILKGHGRDFSANIFLQFHKQGRPLSKALKELTEKYVTSAYRQLEETRQFNRFGIPGSMFGNLLLTARAYRKLGFTQAQLDTLFKDIEDPTIPILAQKSNFLNGMLKAADELGDKPAEMVTPEPLETAYLNNHIDALLILADDDNEFLLRTVRTLITTLESSGIATVLAVELGEALRNNEGEGIEHFGYVDGRSQPLYLDSDFVVKNGKRQERINEKAIRREDGSIDVWDPFASLDHVLLKDPSSDDPAAYGSYFVFRKLEQDVMRFSISEQQLADKLGLSGSDRERAGAMAVGRFRDGTPLTLTDTDGMIPAKSNNFRYDGLDAQLNATQPDDRIGLKCPFHAHIRKTNPRHSTDGFGGPIPDNEKGDRARAITRRGIPYGKRVKHPNAFQALDDLPTGNVGLLFACFQSSIIKQYGFMQKTWANNPGFKKNQAAGTTNGSTGIDPIIGQPITADGNPEHHWRNHYGQSDIPVPAPPPNQLDQLDLTQSHPVNFNLSSFVKFRGGEFFFAPSISFLTREATTRP